MMDQTNLDGLFLPESEPFWLIEGEDCRYWLEEEDSEEYKRKQRIYQKKHRQKNGVNEHEKEQKKEYRQRPEVKAHRKEYQEEYNQRSGVKEHIKEYQEEYNQKSEVKAHKKEQQKEYKQRPGVKEHIKEYQKEYRQRPEVKEHKKEQRKESYQKYYDWVWEQKRSVCVCCGDEEKRLMHFHHIYKPKLFGIMDGGSKPKDIVQLEIEKCVVLCSRCHEMLHKALGTRTVRPFHEIIEVLNDQPHHPELKWLIFLLYPDVYDQWRVI